MATALFSLISKAGKITRNRKGSYKLTLNDLAAEQEWFTDRPQRLQGSISAEEVAQGWSSYFKDSSPNSIVSFTDSDGKLRRFSFEQLQPKLNRKGNKMVSKIIPLSDESRDSITGLNLKRGSSLAMDNPSVVVDDYRLSSITIVNNLKTDLRLLYTVGDIVPEDTNWLQSMVAAGTSDTLAGTTHDKWDLSVEVQDFVDYNWTTGITVQADNPWYGHPQFEYNQSGSYMTSDDALSVPGSAWGILNPAVSFHLTNDPSNDAAWTLTINPA